MDKPVTLALLCLGALAVSSLADTLPDPYQRTD